MYFQKKQQLCCKPNWCLPFLPSIINIVYWSETLKQMYLQEKQQLCWKPNWCLPFLHTISVPCGLYNIRLSLENICRYRSDHYFCFFRQVLGQLKNKSEKCFEKGEKTGIIFIKILVVFGSYFIDIFPCFQVYL